MPAIKRYSLPALLALLLAGQPAHAGVTVNGGLSTGVELYDRTYTGDREDAETADHPAETATDDDEDDYQRFVVQPLIGIDRVTERGSINLTYQPGFYYDFLNEENDLRQQASLAIERKIARNWKLSVTDSFLQADDAEEVETVNPAAEPAAEREPADSAEAESADGGSTSEDRGRRKYVSNTVNLLSEWEYRDDSRFLVGYGYGILRNDEEDDRQQYEDYDRHDVSVQLAHRLSQQWKVNLMGQYVRGLFEEPAADDAAAVVEDDAAVTAEPSNDISEYHAETGAEYSGIAHHPLRLSYGYSLYDYDDEAEGDSRVHDLTLGWQWQYSPHLTFSLAAGPSYAETDGEDDTWGGNGEAGIDYAMEHGRFNFTLAKGLERQNFTGETDNNGLVDYWDGRASYSWRLLESTTLSVFAGYRYEDEDQPVENASPAAVATDTATADEEAVLETVNTQYISAGCAVTYSFWQWYALNLSYRYGNQTSDNIEDEYDEHTVMLRLSFTRDIFQW